MPQMPDSSKYYITTPIYYVNARPHIGHAYSTIVCDILARRNRLLGQDTWFLTGTDEHGQKIERSAKAAGKDPQTFTDEVSAQFRGLWDRMGLSYDDYIRTTEPRHKRGVQKLFAELQKRGFIYKGSYSGQYCVFDGLSSTSTRRRECPVPIADGRPRRSWKKTISSSCRRLSASCWSYMKPIPTSSAPRAAAKRSSPSSKSGLRDLSISRTTFNWGIPVPGDEKHVIYVWLDALANYITAVGYGSDAPEDIAKFQKYWPADLHLVGKEITRFHCVYWPAFLMAAGLPLPKSVTANGWLLFEESKMSKSRGNIVRAETILEVLGNDALRYFLMREIPFGQDGSFSFDALVQRYNADLANGYGNQVSRVLKLIASSRSIEATPDDGDPVGRLRNIVTGFSASERETEWGGLASVALAKLGVMQRVIAQGIGEVDYCLDHLTFAVALEAVWVLIAEVDGYLNVTSPWKHPAGLDEAKWRILQSAVLYASAESIRIFTLLLYPFIPEAASKVWQQLGLGKFKDGKQEKWLPGEYEQLLQWGGLKPGTKLGELGPIFPRAEKDTIKIMQELEESNANANKPVQEVTATPVSQAKETSAPAAIDAPPTPTPAALNAVAPAPLAVVAAPAVQPQPILDAAPKLPEIITIDDFAKVELRVAQIKVALERIPKADNRCFASKSISVTNSARSSPVSPSTTRRNHSSAARL